MSESKLFKSIVLTLVMYGFISFLQWGKFLVPLPAFEMVILGICLYFGILKWKENKTIAVLFLLFGLTQFSAKEYNLALFLSDATLQDLSETLFSDILKITSGILLTVLYIVQSMQHFKDNRIVYLFLAFPLLICLLLPVQWMIVLPLFGICLRFIQQKSLLLNQHSIWGYLFVFALSRELTLLLL